MLRSEYFWETRSAQWLLSLWLLALPDQQSCYSIYMIDGSLLPRRRNQPLDSSQEMIYNTNIIAYILKQSAHEGLMIDIVKWPQFLFWRFYDYMCVIMSTRVIFVMKMLFQCTDCFWNELHFIKKQIAMISKYFRLVMNHWFRNS